VLVKYPEEAEMAPIVVFGGTGFIGSRLVQQLLARGREVTVITRKGTLNLDTTHGNALRCVEIGHEDVTECSFAAALKGATLVYNLAGVSDPAFSSIRSVENLNGNCRLQCFFLEACRTAGTKPRIIYTSSRLVYGKPAGFPVTESTPVRPINYHAAHKLCVEHYHQIMAARNDISYTILRISNAFGVWPLHRTEWLCQVNAMIRSACRGESIQIYGDGRQLRDYVHVSDVVDALIAAGTCSTAQNEIINIGSGQSIPFRKAAEVIAMNGGVDVLYCPWPKEYLFAETGDYVMSLQKARAILGFRPKYQFMNSIADVVRDVRTRLS
jgi:UDP-glucose 4-epimerase